MDLKRIGLPVVVCLLSTAVCIAQQKVIVPDLTSVETDADWSAANRSVSTTSENGTATVTLDARPGDGVVWLKQLNLENGVIEADIRGADIQGRSFVGIAFRGADEETYDAVYFRPFNFLSDDPVRRGHGVQYISHPDYTWHRLRAEHPEAYENPVEPAPDPDAFFHVKIVLEKPVIRVYVNDQPEPCLSVEELTQRSGGWVGFWTGNNSAGTFANLRIVPAN